MSSSFKKRLAIAGAMSVCAFVAFMASGYVAMRLGLTNVPGIADNDKAALISSLDWSKGDEWQTLKAAILKDKMSIYRAADDTDVSPRLIVALLVPEQLRLFHDNREIFKKVFYPLRILGNQSQFSLGVMGIKPETARAIEENSNDHVLDFKTDAPPGERIDRLVSDDHYWSYVYAAMYIKEIEAQWQKAGFPIDNRPDILATLFNIGFADSHPNVDPKSGGAEIDIGSTTYSFGGLAKSFYDSDELIAEFPR